MKNDYEKIEKDEEAFQKYLKNFVIATLRRATYRWSFKHMAKNRSKIERGLYKCESCKMVYGPKQVHVDHIDPVVNVTGFTTWDDYINKLFVKSDKMQVLCIQCHELKSATERELKKIKNKRLTKKKKRVKLK